MTTIRDTTLSARALLLVVAALAAAGCATTPNRPSEELRWPLPPEVARVKFVRAIRSDDDLKASAFRRFWRTLVEDKTAGLIDMPTGLALSVDEKTLYIASPTSTPLLAADLASGRIKRFADSRETRPRTPYGVAVDADDNVYVADSGANAVLVFAKDGKLLRKFGEKLDRPTGIAVDRRGQVLYVVSGASRESDHHRVEVFSLAGKHLRTIGTRGTNAGEFNFPTHLAVTTTGTLFVSDMLNFRVQEFDPEGTLVGMFGAAGQGPGLFDKAKGIAFDTFGNVYVVDSEQAIVQIFNARHQVLMGFGGRLKRLGFMLVPTAIAIDSKNTIYVADYAGRCVSEYQLVNTTAADSYPDQAPKTDGVAPAKGDGAAPATSGTAAPAK
jgi:DNA-binding beta-propeller fold protein YncE